MIRGRESNIGRETDREKDGVRGWRHSGGFLESSLFQTSREPTVAGESHEISEEKHVSRTESIATMPWQKHEASARERTKGAPRKGELFEPCARG